MHIWPWSPLELTRILATKSIQQKRKILWPESPKAELCESWKQEINETELSGSFPVIYFQIVD